MLHGGGEEIAAEQFPTTLATTVDVALEGVVAQRRLLGPAVSTSARARAQPVPEEL